VGKSWPVMTSYDRRSVMTRLTGHDSPTLASAGDGGSAAGDVKNSAVLLGDMEETK